MATPSIKILNGNSKQYKFSAYWSCLKALNMKFTVVAKNNPRATEQTWRATQKKTWMPSIPHAAREPFVMEETPTLTLKNLPNF